MARILLAPQTRHMGKGCPNRWGSPYFHKEYFTHPYCCFGLPPNSPSRRSQPERIWKDFNLQVPMMP